MTTVEPGAKVHEAVTVAVVPVLTTSLKEQLVLVSVVGGYAALATGDGNAKRTMGAAASAQTAAPNPAATFFSRRMDLLSVGPAYQGQH
jgi:hypothetical protein